MAKRVKDGRFWTFWRGVSLVMVFANFILASYILYKFNMLGDLRDIANNVDNAIVFSLSLLQTLIALGAFAGFWVVRSSARDAAREAAEVSVSKFVQTDDFATVLNAELLSPEIQALIRRTVTEVPVSDSGDCDDSEEINQLAMAAGDEEEPRDE